VQALIRAGHQVHVAASFGVAAAEAEREMRCSGVLSLPHVSRLDRRKLVKYLVVYPWSILRLALYIRQTSPDVVISHNTVAGFGALLGRWWRPDTVTVLDLTDLLFEYLDSYNSRWIRLVLSFGRALERYTIRHSDRIVTISRAMRDILVRDGQVCPDRIDIVHDGVDCLVFQPQDSSELRQRVSPWAKHVCILHGVLDPQDDLEVLVDAAPTVLGMFPDTAFWWVGDGAAVPALKARADELGVSDRFFFAGWVTQDEVKDYVNASDLGIVVLPDTLSARGRVTLKEFEYWACGKAAVLPRLPALREIIPDGEASLFFVPGNAEDLARVICTLLGNDDRRQAMGNRGRRMVMERFDWRALADGLARLTERHVAGLSAGPQADQPAGGTA